MKVEPVTPEYYLEHTSGLRKGPFKTDIEAWEWLCQQHFNTHEAGWHCFQRVWTTDVSLHYNEEDR